VVVPGCLALGWWQLQRALGGNDLSWAYTFEWPLFAGYGTYMWWRLVHEDPAVPSSGTPSRGATADGAGGDGVGARAGPAPDPAGPDPADGGGPDDEELAAYNRYLAALHASGRRKHW